MRFLLEKLIYVFKKAWKLLTLISLRFTASLRILFVSGQREQVQ